MSDQSYNGYQFGSFYLDPVNRNLFRGASRIHLTPKVFSTLLFLVQNSGRLVKKEEIIGAVWPESFVEESNLNQNIFVLRKALGERPGQKYILTVQTQGFRFIAPVKELKDGNPHLQDREVSGQAATSAKIRSLAILPFKYLGPTSSDQYLGYGIADALVMRLSGSRELIVRPTTAVLKYNVLEQDPVAAGLELNVDAVIDGTIQLIADRIRVTVQLIKVYDGATVWADKFDEEFTNIFALQDLISEQVVKKLPLKLSLSEHDQLMKGRTADTEAYKLYLKGRYFWEKRTKAALLKSLEYFDEAIRRDPVYALAYTGIADSYILLGQYLFFSPEETLPKAKASALKALAINDSLAEAHASLGETLLYYDWSHAEAEKAYRRALELNPNYASAYHWYAWFLMGEERFDEALLIIKRAQELDPFSLELNTSLGLPFYFMRRYDLAIEQFDETLEMDPSFTNAHYYKGSALVHKGMYEEAIAEYQRGGTSEYLSQTVAVLGYAQAMSGRVDEAMNALNTLKAFSEKRYISPYSMAIVHTGLGDSDEAFRWLEKAYTERAAWLIWLKIDPFMDPLRDDPRFHDLLTRIRS
jgi:TolB-like protein/Flp pilus assembly protein TadD